MENLQNMNCFIENMGGGGEIRMHRSVSSLLKLTNEINTLIKSMHNLSITYISNSITILFDMECLVLGVDLFGITFCKLQTALRLTAQRELLID